MFRNFMVWGLLLLGISGSAVLYAEDGNRVQNGGFEKCDPQGKPLGWETVISAPKVKFEAKCVTGLAHSGNRCLRIVTDYPTMPEVYGCVRVNIPCEPMTEYHFVLSIRSVNNGGGWFGGGRNWAWVNTIPQGTYDWTTLNAWYRTGPDETSIPFMLHVFGKSMLYFDDLTVTRVGPSSEPTILPSYKTWTAAALKTAVTGLKNDLSQWRQQLDALAAAGAHTDYTRVKLACLEAFLPIAEKRLDHDKYRQAATVMVYEMQLLAKRLQADLALLKQNPHAYPDVYRYQTGGVKLDGWAMTGMVQTPDGKTIRRPVILNGFGHFFTIVDQLEKWPERGCNLIQIEFGPQFVKRVNGQLQIDPKELAKLTTTFQRAEKANVSIMLLLSPHYLPNEAGAGWSSDEPGPWEYYRVLVSGLLSGLKDSPALHSIILSNEPHCFAGPKDPSLLRAWRAYLPAVYPDIAALNRAYGTKYAAFEQVPMPSAELDRKIVDAPISPVESLTGKFPRKQRPWLYDYVQCKELRFAAWHKRLADLVHEFAPMVPVHSKITGGYYMGHPVADGIDVEKFAAFTEYCGFDEVGGLRIIYDLYPSFRPAPQINSENHLIQPDVTFDQINPERIYADLFIQAMHGQTASATWVFEPYYEGLINNTFGIRPAGMEAVARAGMDLMRVAPELAAIQQTPRKVAILYSPLSWWYDDPSHGIWRSAWTAFCDRGTRVRFLSEKQLQSGACGAVSVLILAGTTVVEPATLEALRKFKERGGRILAVGRNLEFGPGWQPLNRDQAKAIPDGYLGMRPGWEERLTEMTVRAGVRPPVQLLAADGKPLCGVHYLSGVMDGKPVTAVINISGPKITVADAVTADGHRLSSGRDTLRDRPFTLPVMLLPYEGAVWRWK